MNPKQKTFCEEYLIDLNATQAAIRAGYSEKTAKEIGYENLTKPHLQLYITELKEKRSEETKIDAAWVLTQAVEIVADARADDNHAAATGALKLVGQHVDVKALVERRESKTDVTHTDLTDEELAAKYKAMKKQEEG